MNCSKNTNHSSVHQASNSIKIYPWCDEKFVFYSLVILNFNRMRNLMMTQILFSTHISLSLHYSLEEIPFPHFLFYIITFNVLVHCCSFSSQSYLVVFKCGRQDAGSEGHSAPHPLCTCNSMSVRSCSCLENQFAGPVNCEKIMSSILSKIRSSGQTSHLYQHKSKHRA